MSYYLGKLAKDLYLASTLYDAIEDHDFRAISYTLMEKRADPNIMLQNGITPLHLALGNDDPTFALQVTKLMMQHGGNPNIRTDDGLTPLHIAAAWGRFELVKLLICCGADPEIRDYCNAMPIDYAAENENVEIVQYLHYVTYCGPTFADLEDNPEFNLTLDMIIVNNGIAKAQYEVDKALNLEQLPQVSSSELVENWCSKHNGKTQQHSDVSQTNSSHTNLKPVPNTLFVNCNPRNYKKPSISEHNSSLEFACSNKFISKRPSTTTGVEVPALTNVGDFNFAEASQESGIAILPDDSSDVCILLEQKPPFVKRLHDTSSDYFTCNEISGSTNILEKNVVDESLSELLDEFDLNNSVSSNKTNQGVECASIPSNNNNSSDDLKYTECTDKESRLSIVEVYKYSDVQEGIVIYENRLLVNPNSNHDQNNSYHSQSSKLTSLPASFDYDTEALRRELNKHGFGPGPITKTTKRVYLRKLLRLKKTMPDCVKQLPVCSPKVFSKELEKTLNDSNWLQDLSCYRSLEDIIFREFNNPDLSRRWREGINKSSFTYLLLDPRITNNLPVRHDSLTIQEKWKTFLSSIFYVGKGKRTRPYAHLYEAVIHWNKKGTININKKLEHIINIWKDDAGVVCLHIFQNVIPCEAYTREAAMIKALKLKNIDNQRLGDFYGTACTWSSKQQKMLGVLLLHKAMLIFLNEGERQLKPADIN